MTHGPLNVKLQIMICLRKLFLTFISYKIINQNTLILRNSKDLGKVRYPCRGIFQSTNANNYNFLHGKSVVCINKLAPS